jgi:exopolysaccharide biosynthesis protein
MSRVVVSLAHRRNAVNALLVDGGQSDPGAVSKSGREPSRISLT